jgi:hypothetical protein
MAFCYGYSQRRLLSHSLLPSRYTLSSQFSLSASFKPSPTLRHGTILPQVPGLSRCTSSYPGKSSATALPSKSLCSQLQSRKMFCPKSAAWNVDGCSSFGISTAISTPGRPESARLERLLWARRGILATPPVKTTYSLAFGTPAPGRLSPAAQLPFMPPSRCITLLPLRMTPMPQPAPPSRRRLSSG